MVKVPAQQDVAEPFVSVVVPVYKGEGMIGECIESLLDQEYPQGWHRVGVVRKQRIGRRK